MANRYRTVFTGRSNTSLQRMKERDKASGEFQLSGGPPRTLSVEVVREFYFEESELAVPPVFAPATAEEKKSGFPE